jgi:hypothetical protein
MHSKISGTATLIAASCLSIGGLSGALTAQPIFDVKVTNMANTERISPLCIGLPEDHGATPINVSVVSPGGDSFPGVIRQDAEGRGSILLTTISMAAGTTETLQVVQSPGTPPPFQADWVLDEPVKLVPRFVMNIDGTDVWSPPLDLGTSLYPIELGGMRQVWAVDTQISEGPIFIKGFFHIYNGSQTVEFEIRSSFGSTDPDSLMRRNFGSLRMVVGEYPHVDWARRKGLGGALVHADPNFGGAMWEREITAPQEWVRCGTHEVTGALLCLPPAPLMQTAFNDPRMTELIGRMQVPMLGMATNWDGHWGALGQVPTPPVNALALQNQAWWQMLNEFNTPGSDRLLVVSVAVEADNPDADVSTVTYNGVTLTKAIDRVVGTPTDIATPIGTEGSAPGQVDSENVWYTLKVEVSGTSIKCYLDDIL